MRQKKPTPKKPNREGRAVTFWMDTDLYGRLEKFRDEFAARHLVRPSITDLIHGAVRHYLDSPPK